MSRPPTIPAEKKLRIVLSILQNEITIAEAARREKVSEAEQLLGHPLINDPVVDPETGEIRPVLTIVTDNGGPFRSFRFEAFITAHPELRHVRTRVRTPGQNESRERGFGSMKYAWLFREEIDHGLSLVEQINAYRHDYNHVRPHEAISWNRPADVHAGRADPTIPNLLDARQVSIAPGTAESMLPIPRAITNIDPRRTSHRATPGPDESCIADFGR